MSIDDEPSVEALVAAWRFSVAELSVLLSPNSADTEKACGELVGVLERALLIFRPDIGLASARQDTDGRKRAHAMLSVLKANLTATHAVPRNPDRAYEAGFALGTVVTQIEKVQALIGRDVDDARRTTLVRPIDLER